MPCGPGPLISLPPPSSAVACYTGTTLDGRYEIERILGEGGMGVVYLARHKVIDKRVAVKILRADFVHQKDIADRFLQEAKAASSIGNPHVVDISDFGVLDDGSAYFVMESLDGYPLSDLTRTRKPVPVTKIIRNRQADRRRVVGRARARDRASRSQAGQRVPGAAR